MPLKQVTVNDEFWGTEQELVRTTVIPYQWNALNDNVPGAAPSYCMHNFKAAARQNAAKQNEGKSFTPPTYTFRGFEALPDDPDNPDPDKFYGFVFQDTDFSKWIETVGYSLAHHPDADLEATADAAIDIVCAAQLDNGYLDTYYILNGMDRHFTNLKDHHELYCLGHLIEGAVAYYQGTGKRKLLDAACRFADYVDSVFGKEPGKLPGYPGHEIAEMALVRLYETTGEQRYLRLAQYFINERGQEPLYFEQEDRARAEHDGTPYTPNTNMPLPYAYYQAHLPVVEQDEAVGHAVRAVYLYSGAADVARLTDDADLATACNRLWRNIVDRKLYVTGGIGGTHIGESFSFDYDLPNDTAYSETCAAIGLAFFARRMLQIRPVAEYADVMESALYNTMLAGMALDGKSFFYVNPLEVDPVACCRDERKAHVKSVRQKWFGCACCPPNIARTVESIQEYAYTVSDDSSTLFTHLYIGGEATAVLNGQTVRLEMTSELPWHGNGTAVVHIDGESQSSATAVASAPEAPHATTATAAAASAAVATADRSATATAATAATTPATAETPATASITATTTETPSASATATSTVTATLAFRLPTWAGGQDAADDVFVTAIQPDGSFADIDGCSTSSDLADTTTDNTDNAVDFAAKDNAVASATGKAGNTTNNAINNDPASRATGNAENNANHSTDNGAENATNDVTDHHVAHAARARITREVRDGYLYLTGEWHDGDKIVFDFPMPVRMLAANPHVREDAGKVAFARGPITFCAEGVDNGDDLHLLHVDAWRIADNPSCVMVEDITFHAGAEGMDDSGLGEVDATDRPMVRLIVPGWREPCNDSSQGSEPLYHQWQPANHEPVSITLIPYFAWANRGENEMTVWLRT